MAKLIDISGEVFGRLEVLRRVESDKMHGAVWECKCECGNTTQVRSDHLRKGLTMSCGCLQKELASERATTHGHTTKSGYHPMYWLWIGMRQRCSDKNSHGYKYYGARGIQVCQKWSESFDAFLADMGERPEGKTLDRINNDGDYEPGNCRWASTHEQAANKRPNKISYAARLIDPDGIRHVIKKGRVRAFCGEVGINYKCVLRILSGERGHHVGWTGLALGVKS